MRKRGHSIYWSPNNRSLYLSKFPVYLQGWNIDICDHLSTPMSPDNDFYYSKDGSISLFWIKKVQSFNINYTSTKSWRGYTAVCLCASCFSRSKVKVKFSPKWIKNSTTGQISDAISPTAFILGTKIQHKNAHSMTQVPMTLNQGKGQRSRSNFPQNGKENKDLVISRRLFHIQTSYLVLRYNP